MKKMLNKICGALLLLLLTAGLAACNGENGENGDTDTPSATQASDPTPSRGVTGFTITAAERDAEATATSLFDARIISEAFVDTGFGMNDDFGGYNLVFELENVSERDVSVTIIAVFHRGYGVSATLIEQNAAFSPGQARQFTHSFGEYEVETSSHLVIEYIIEGYTHTTQDEAAATLPHPFAIALREYMASYGGVVRAYLTTLHDDGAIGVLTTRPTTRVLYDYDSGEYRYGPSTTLFYILDGNLHQIDVSGWLFVAGRYNRLMERIYAHTHIVEFIFQLESGGLEVSTQLEYFSDEYLSMLFDDYDTVAELIAERDARAEYAREKYGLVALPPPNLGHMRNTQDQTAQILAMTADCVPSLD